MAILKFKLILSLALSLTLLDVASASESGKRTANAVQNPRHAEETPSRLWKPALSPDGFSSLDDGVAAFLASAAWFDFKDGGAVLCRQRVDHSPAGIHARYELQRDGVPVPNGRLDVHLDAKNRVYFGVDTLPRPDAAWETAFPNVQEAQAVALSDFRSRLHRQRETALGPPPDVMEESRRKVFWITEGSPRAAWEIVLLNAKPFERQIYILGGTPVGVLAILQGVLRVDGTGQVFVPNPVNALKNTSLFPTSPAEVFLPAYQVRPLRGLNEASGGKYALAGPYVRVKALSNEPPAVSPPQEATPNFLYERSNPGFGAVMAYYWIDESIRYLHSLGFSDLMTFGLAVDAHGLDGEDNSHYWPNLDGRGHIAFGDGGVPDAEDADVILHELGHAIQDNTAPNYFLTDGQAGAIGEGFGDYWAFSNTYNASVANGFDPFCTAEWDFCNIADGDPPCLRRLDTEKVFPHDLVDQVHTDGEIWSCALMHIFLRLGKTVSDTIVVQSHYLMPYSPSFFKGAIAMLEADSILYQGQNKWVIFEEFERRGVFLTGDLNANRIFNVQDLVILGQYVVGAIQWGQGYFTSPTLACDLNRDNAVNALDYVLMAARLAQ